MTDARISQLVPETARAGTDPNARVSQLVPETARAGTAPQARVSQLVPEVARRATAARARVSQLVIEVAYPNPTIPVVQQLFFRPLTDTLRGGAEMSILFGEAINTTRDRTFTTQTLPSGFTPTLTGTGQLAPSTQGLVFDTGTTSQSRAGVTSGVTYLRGDMAVDVEWLDPYSSATAVTTPIDVFVFEAASASGATARVRLWHDGLLHVSAEVVSASGEVIPGGTVVWPAARATFRIIRNATRVWTSVAESRTADGIYTGEVLLQDWSAFAADAGVLRMRTSNAAQPRRLRSRVTNFTVRSHVVVGNNLLNNKRDYAPTRLVGAVPAAPITALGNTSVTIFGLAGAVVGAESFVYTLPPAKVIGRTAESSLSTIQDPALKGT